MITILLVADFLHDRHLERADLKASVGRFSNRELGSLYVEKDLAIYNDRKFEAVLLPQKGGLLLRTADQLGPLCFPNVQRKTCEKADLIYDPSSGGSWYSFDEDGRKFVFNRVGSNGS